MRHPIDPTVDYAFKRLLGDPANADLLISFLNAILKPDPPVVEVDILNPFNEKQFEDDKLAIVDVKAMLADRSLVQVEVQTSNPPHLRQRMFYGWADLYQSQLSDGQDYTELCPVAAIWVLRRVLFPSGRSVHHRFRAVDVDQGLHLGNDFSIHTLELPRVNLEPEGLDEEREDAEAGRIEAEARSENLAQEITKLVQLLKQAGINPDAAPTQDGAPEPTE